MLRLLYVLLPLLCWAFLVRTRVVGAAVLALLAGLAVALVGLQQEWYSTRAAAEFEAGYPLLSGLVVLAGALTERRLRGPGRRRSPAPRSAGPRSRSPCTPWSASPSASPTGDSPTMPSSPAPPRCRCRPG
ncbi:hypothetical protein ACFQ0M_30715 [Kitasatospora aburaviensis]